MTFFLASDHAGFLLKEAIRRDLLKRGLEVRDCGVYGSNPANWAEMGARAAREVSLDPEHGRAVLVCGSGIGMSMVANRYPGVRAALCHNEEAAEMTRRHNDANVLCLGARVVGESTALAILNRWLSTPFDGGRHAERLAYLAGHVEKDVLGLGRDGMPGVPPPKEE